MIDENKYVHKDIVPSNTTKKTLIPKYKCDKTSLETSKFYGLLIHE